MFKEYLLKNQPIVYKILLKSMSNNTSHAFLINGNDSILNKQISLFISQSLICENDILACEKCINCEKIKNNIYADFIIFDGEKETIKKENILHIQNLFSKTALEKQGKKIYILNSIEKSSISALNSLLKFLEEPSDNTYAILTTTNIEKVLSTITSRCQIINVRNNVLNVKENEFEDIDSYILSNINVSAIEEIKETEEYQLGFLAFQKFVESKNDLYGVLYYIQNSLFTKNNANNIIILGYFVDILSLFLKDKQTGVKTNLEKYNEYLSLFNDEDYSELILLLKNSKDKCNMNNFNVNLILDQLFYEIIKVGIL